MKSVEMVGGFGEGAGGRGLGFRRLSPQQQARWLVAQEPLILDTETTGLGIRDEVVEVAVLDIRGHVLVDTLIRSTCTISGEAMGVHGITDGDIQDAMNFAEWAGRLREVLRSCLIVAYNAAFDQRMLRQSALANGLAAHTLFESAWYCAMELYQSWAGYHRWQKLERALEQCGIAAPDDFHRAAADAEATRRLLLHMANVGKAHG